MKKFEKIAHDFNTIPADIRAEVLLAQCIESGLVQKEFAVQADGFFYRTYVHDLYETKVDDQNKYMKFLSLHLSRPGLYDALPEGLFFQAEAGGRKAKTAAEMAEEYRLNKKKEKEIRKFFAPFENEFFLHTLQNETIESNLLQGLRSGWLKEYFIDFWGLPPDMPVNAALVMVMFLPYVHIIAGNLEATAGVLEKIINEPVKIDLKYNYDNAGYGDYNVLGRFALGSELVCGKSFREQFPVVSVNIGPLQKTKGYQYVNGGNYFSLLQVFYNYFIPANAEVKTNVLLKSKAEKLILNKNEDAPLLGISSVI
jgi:hypothetical protein